MIDLLATLLRLFLVLVVWAAVGHVCFRIMAAAVRALRQLVSGTRTPERDFGARGLSLQASKDTTLELLAAMVRAGRLTPDTFDQVQQALRSDAPLRPPARSEASPVKEAKAAENADWLTDDGPLVERTDRIEETTVERAPAMAEAQAVMAEVVGPPVGGPGAATASNRDAAEQARTQADRYLERQRAAPPAAPRKPVSPPEPRPSLAEWFAVFIEEKNIRWGELIGGLLIVSCSAALVVSFWSAIAERLFLQYFVFNGVNAFMFLVGLHAARRWRLPTTSTGILLIACLLTPLNFLALSSFSPDGSGAGRWLLAGEVASLAVFTALTYAAGRQLFPAAAIPWTLGVMIPSGAELLVRRWIDASATLPPMYAVGAVVGGVYLLANTWNAHTLRGKERWSDHEYFRLWQVLGVSTFATLLALGMLLVKTRRVEELLPWLSPLGVAVALPSILLGLLVHRETRQLGDATRSLTSLSVALVGGLMLLASLAAAWPIPAMILVGGILAWVLLSGVAVWTRTPAGHYLALAAITPAFLAAVHLTSSDWTWHSRSWPQAMELLLSARSGNCLIGLSTAVLAGGMLWNRWQRRGDAEAYWISGGAVAAISYSLLVVFGLGRPGDPQQAFWGFAAYALLAAGAATLTRHQGLTCLASALLLVATVQGIVFRWSPEEQWRTSAALALLTHAGLLALCAAAADATGERWSPLKPHLASGGLATSCLSLAWMVFFACTSSTPLSGWMLLLAALNLMWIAWATADARIFGAFQVTLLASLTVAVHDGCIAQPWAQEAHPASLHPWAVQAQALAWSLFGGAWSLKRRAVQAWQARTPDALRGSIQRRLAQLLAPAWPVDRCAAPAALSVSLLVCLYGLIPGVAQEISPRGLFAESPVAELAARGAPALSNFELQGLPHAPALGWWSWWALAGLAAAVWAGGREQRRTWVFAQLAVILLGAVFLLAGRWEPQVAVASALRWGVALHMAVVSILAWSWPWMRRRWNTDPAPASSAHLIGFPEFSAMVGLLAAPVLAMLLFVAVGALRLAPPDAQQLQAIRGLAACFLAAMAVGGTCYAAAERMARSRADAGPPPVASWMRVSGITVSVLGVMPLVATTLFVVGQALGRHPIVGPNPDSFFAEIGLPLSYALPLVVVAAAFVGHAIGLKSEPVGLSAGLLCNLGATAAYLLAFRGAGQFSTEQWFRLAQLNSAVSAIFALGWTVYALKRERRFTGLLSAQVSIAAGFIGSALLVCVGMLWWDPSPNVAVHHLAGWPGWSTLALLVVAAIAYARAASLRFPLHLLYPVAVAAAWLLGVQTDLWDPGAQWTAVSALMGCSVLAAGTILFIDWRWPSGALGASWYGLLGVRDVKAAGDEVPYMRRLSTTGAWWSSLVLFTAALFALRVSAVGPLSPWWPMGIWLACAALWVLVALGRLAAWPLWWSALVSNGAASIWWLHEASRNSWDVLYVNLWAAALPCVLWVAVERRRCRLLGEQAGPRAWSVHLWLVPAAVGGLVLLASGSLLGNLVGRPLDPSPLQHWRALAAAAAASVACLWDRRAAWAVSCLYLAGLAMAFAVANAFDLPPRMLVHVTTLALAAYAVGSSYLWSRREAVSAWCLRRGWPLHEQHFSHAWVIRANSLLAMLVLILGVCSQFTAEQAPLRFALAHAVLAQTVSMGLLAYGQRETLLRYASLAIGTAGVVTVAWSFLPCDDLNTVHRLSAASAACCFLSAVYGLGLAKVLAAQNAWTLAALQITPVPMLLAALGLTGTIGVEILQYASGEPAPAAWSVAVTAAALLGGCVLLLTAAVAPGRDPLGLSERGRMAYIYAAEAVVAAAFIHLRVTAPYLFGGVFDRHWPLILMAIAFLGVGFAEWFRHRRTRVLAEPLERTGVLLPLLPALGFWLAPPEVDSPTLQFSLLLVTIGMLYSGMSLLRRSFAYGALSALAFNAGFWALLAMHAPLAIGRHPQVWLIPPAACVLAAAHLHRRGLSESQMTTVRYLTATTIYVSSTADVFLNGVAKAPWLPLVLAGLSLLGVFAGILLRVRAFLYLGISFLSLALLTMVWYAAVDLEQTWIWYVCGIVAGVMIIALFALFERKRHEVHVAMEKFRTWQA